MALETNKPSFGVLDDVKVVYAAVELAVPKACDLMADWGADVTWLENTGAGDTIRDTAYVKQAERRNQRSVSLNYFSDEGKEVLFKMLADADIFIEASKGGTWARKGITDEVLWEINPKLVIVHLSGFGQSGDPKMVKRAAYDLTVMSYSGYMSQNGTQEQPMNPGPYAGDYFNSLMVVSSTLAALHKANRTGKGESIDMAMYETLLAIGQYYLVDYLNEGILWPRPGRSQPEPLRHRRVQVQRRLPGRVPVRRRPEQVLPGDHRSGSPVGHRGHPGGHLRPVAVQSACCRDRGRVRGVLLGALQVRDRGGLCCSPHRRSGRHGVRGPREGRAPQAAR